MSRRAETPARRCAGECWSHVAYVRGYCMALLRNSIATRRASCRVATRRHLKASDANPRLRGRTKFQSRNATVCVNVPRPETGLERWPTAVDRQIDSLLKQPVALSFRIVEPTHGLASQLRRNRGMFRLRIKVAGLSLRDDADTPSTSTSTILVEVFVESTDGIGCDFLGGRSSI